MICDKCGKTFGYGSQPDGEPNGLTFYLKGGDQITLCHDCLCRVAEEGIEYVSDILPEGYELD